MLDFVIVNLLIFSPQILNFEVRIIPFPKKKKAAELMLGLPVF